MTITTETPPSDRTDKTRCSMCDSILTMCLADCYPNLRDRQLLGEGIGDISGPYFCDSACRDDFYSCTTFCDKCDDYMFSHACLECGLCEECGCFEDCDSCKECQRDKLCYYHGSEYVDNLSRLPYFRFIDGEFTEIARPDTI